jgi:hypothetical protein
MSVGGALDLLHQPWRVLLQVSQQTMWDLWMPFAAHVGCSEKQANEMCRRLQEARNAGQALSAKSLVSPYLHAQEAALNSAMRQVEQAMTILQV